MRDVGLDRYEDELVAADILELLNHLSNYFRRYSADGAQQILDLAGKYLRVVVAKIGL